ncbi:Hypothetical protein PBC10988_23130 [Planctomycetales bacterium 10988]|nr:Hypothetical protein PBC10988_23130 [Planctomycetales bacterium 10988]
MPATNEKFEVFRPDIGGALMEYDLAASQEGFIGTRVLPIREVQSETLKFGKITIESLLRKRKTRRAPGTPYNRAEYDFTSDSYTTEEHGIEEPVDDREAKMYQDIFEAEMVATERARDGVLRAQEARIAELLFNTSVWTGTKLTKAAEELWSNHANAKPLSDVKFARKMVRANIGRLPNTLILGWEAYEEAKFCDQIIERVKYQEKMDVRPGLITPQQLASVFDVEQVVIAGAQENGANPEQEASLTEIWDPALAMVAKVARSRDIREPCLGRIFHWGEDGSQAGALVESYRENQSRSEIMRSRMDTDEKILYVEAGFLLTGLLAGS